FAGITGELSSNLNFSVNYDYLIHRLTGSQTLATNENFMVSDSYDRQTVSLGSVWTVNPKLSLNGSIGHTWFDYTDGTKQSSPVWNAAATYKLTEKITLGAGYSENYSYSVNSGTYKSEMEQGSIGYSGKIPLSLSLFRTTDTYNDLDRKDRSTGATLSSSAPITSKIKGRLSGTFQDLKFVNPGTETAKRYSVDAALDYL